MLGERCTNQEWNDGDGLWHHSRAKEKKGEEPRKGRPKNTWTEVKKRGLQRIALEENKAPSTDIWQCISYANCK